MLALVYIYIFEFLDFEETRKSIETDDSFPRFRSISSYSDNRVQIRRKKRGIKIHFDVELYYGKR